MTNDEMPSDIERVLCNYTGNDRNAISRFLGVAELLGYTLTRTPAPVTDEARREAWSMTQPDPEKVRAAISHNPMCVNGCAVIDVGFYETFLEVAIAAITTQSREAELLAVIRDLAEASRLDGYEGYAAFELAHRKHAAIIAEAKGE